MLAVALLLSALTLVPSPIPASFRPTYFEITSSWSYPQSEPPAPDASGSTDITCYYRRAVWHCTGGWIENVWVERLLAAARISDEPGQVRLAGYSDKAIALLAHQLQEEILDTPQWNAAERRAALSLATADAVRGMLVAQFRDAGTAPSSASVTGVFVHLRDAGNHVVVIESSSQRERMLPWRVSYDGRAVTFAHAAISAAIAAFLPPGEANRSRHLREQPDPLDSLLSTIDFRVIACMYDENPADRKFCAFLKQ